jgi:NAD(P)H-dependent FMN reductase
MPVLTISGSLRANSLNTKILRFAARAALPGVDIHLCDALDRLPHFNPDLDTDSGPAAVATFRAQLNGADAVVICSPEYAHGVPGALKNALDWVVGSGEFVSKPVALWNLSTRAVDAHASLVEALQTMSALVLPEACFTCLGIYLLVDRLDREARKD